MSEVKQNWREEVVQRLRGVKYPGFSRDIVSFGVGPGHGHGRDGFEIEAKDHNPRSGDS